MSEFTHPSNLFGRISYNQSIRRNIFRDHSSGSNKSIFTNVVAADDSCISSDRRALLNDSSQVLTFSDNSTSRIVDICENHGRAKKNIVFTDNAGINTN